MTSPKQDFHCYTRRIQKVALLALTLFALTGLATVASAQDQAAVKAIAMELGFDSEKVSYVDANGNGKYDDGEEIRIDIDCSEEMVKAVGAAAKKHPELAIQIGEALVLLSEEIDPDCLSHLAAEIIRQLSDDGGEAFVGDGKSVVEPSLDGKSVVEPFDSEALLAAMAALMPDTALIATFTEQALALMPSITVPGTDGDNNIRVEKGDDDDDIDGPRPGPRRTDPAQVTPIN